MVVVLWLIISYFPKNNVVLGSKYVHICIKRTATVEQSREDKSNIDQGGRLALRGATLGSRQACLLRARQPSPPRAVNVIRRKQPPETLEQNDAASM